MTTEQKAKAYDEALKVANNELRACGTFDCDCARQIFRLFPELKENKEPDDEKVRKGLIELVKQSSEILEKKNQEQMIDWLEKQGQVRCTGVGKKEEAEVLKKMLDLEKKMITPEKSLGIDSETYNKIVDECIYGDEQKPSDKKPKFKIGDKIYLKPEYRMPDDDTPIANTVKEIIGIDDKHYRFYGSYIFIEDQDKYELVEQKPTDEGMKTLLQTEYEKGRADAIAEMQKWNEEDEKFVHGLIRGLSAKRDIYGHTTFSSDGIDITETIDWLKSLKYRVQPKQEWSEEDKKNLEKTIWYVEKGGELIFTKTDKLVSWLKSLRPQNRWKPSEGQLECLGYAIEKAEKDWSPLTNNRIYLTLKALKEQLLELRGSKV